MRDCRCPDSPHSAGDFAYLKPVADLELGLAAHQVVGNALEATHQNGSSLTPEQAFAMIQIKLGVSYAIHGIAAWDLLDEHGKSLPINAATVQAIKWTEIEPVADKAAELYAEEVLVPLVARLSRSSRTGQTAGSTSATRRTSTKRPKPSKRSTTASTQPLPPASSSSAGDSSTSQSLE